MTEAKPTGTPPPTTQGTSVPGDPKDGLELLMKRAQAGDATAVGELVSRVAPVALRAARMVLGWGAQDIEDAVQDGLLGFVQALPRFRGECSASTLTTRIAVRAALLTRKRRQRRAQRFAPLELAPEPASSDTQAPSLEGARRRELLRSLIDELPEAQGETLALRVIMEMSLEEVATATGVPVNTVRSRMRLAREALRERIEADPTHSEALGEVEP